MTEKPQNCKCVETTGLTDSDSQGFSVWLQKRVNQITALRVRLILFSPLMDFASLADWFSASLLPPSAPNLWKQ